MPQSLANVLVHIVFSTKGRKPLLANHETKVETHRYLAGIAKRLDCVPLKIDGLGDHVHLLLGLSRTITIAELVKELKRGSTHWLKNNKTECKFFQWQAGYGCFSVSESNKQSLVEYIENQEEHHRKMGFQEEMRVFYDKHGIDVDETYLWD